MKTYAKVYLGIFFILTITFVSLWNPSKTEQFKSTKCHIDDAILINSTCNCCCAEKKRVTVPCPTHKAERQPEISRMLQDQTCHEVRTVCTNKEFVCWSAEWKVTVFLDEKSEDHCSKEFTAIIDGKIMDSDKSNSSDASKLRAQRDLDKRAQNIDQECYFNINDCETVKWSIPNSSMMILFYIFLLLLILPISIHKMLSIWNDGRRLLVIFILFAISIFSSGVGIYVEKKTIYSLVFIIIGCISIIILFFAFLKDRDIFNICEIFRNCGMRKQAQEFKHLGSQSRLNTMLKIEELASSKEGQEPDTLIISQNT